MVAQLIGAVLLGLATAATPEGVLAVLVLLGAKRGLSKGAAFALGLTTSVTAALVVGFMLSSSLGTGRGGRGSDIFNLAVGVLLTVLGILAWLQPPERLGRLMTKVLGHVDNTPLWLAFGLGTMSVNLVPGFALGARLSTAALPIPRLVLVAVVFVLVGTLCVTIPLMLSMLLPSRWAAWSGTVRKLAVVRGNSLLGIVLVAVGLLFTVEAVLRLLR
jgi:hypothetical protein